MTRIESAEPTESSAPAKGEVRHQLLTPLSADLLAGVSTLVTGALTFWQATEERAHKNLSSLYLTEDIKAAREKFGVQLREEVKSGKLTPPENKKLYQDAIRKFETKMDERFARAGITNLWDKWSLLRGHQKWAVSMTTLAVGGISLGSILLLSREIISEKEGEPFTKKLAKKELAESHER